MFTEKYKSYLYAKYGNKRPEFFEPRLNNSILGKRKLVDAFGIEIYNDHSRYGQSIPPDFFSSHLFKKNNL